MRRTAIKVLVRAVVLGLIFCPLAVSRSFASTYATTRHRAATARLHTAKKTVRRPGMQADSRKPSHPIAGKGATHFRHSWEQKPASIVNQSPLKRRSTGRWRRARKPHGLVSSETGRTAVAAVAASGNVVAKTVSLSKKSTLMPAPLRGSLDSLTRQNEMAEAEGLERIEDEDDLADRIAQKVLVPLPETSALAVNANLPAAHRYCRPWTARFLADLARIHEAQFHHPIEVSSAVRTVEYQKQLMRINGNAAAAEGDVVSPHLTGATVDIAKSGLDRKEIGWMRGWLLPLQLAGKIDVEEEFRQQCFHITVYKSYAMSEAMDRTIRAKASPEEAAPAVIQPESMQKKRIHPTGKQNHPAANSSLAAQGL